MENFRVMAKTGFEKLDIALAKTIAKLHKLNTKVIKMNNKIVELELINAPSNLRDDLIDQRILTSEVNGNLRILVNNNWVIKLNCRDTVWEKNQKK